LYDKKVWIIKLAAICILLLSISFSIKSINQDNTSSITWLNLKKHQGIIFKKGNEAVVISDIKTTDKTWQYSIQPYLDSCKISNMQVFGISDNIKISWLVKRNNLIQFKDKRLFVFNGQLKDTSLFRKVKADYIYITGNPRKELAALNNNFDYKTLIIDGSNSDKLIESIEEQSKATNITYKILKRNKSIITVSNYK
jgi:competence protein ComEC